MLGLKNYGLIKVNISEKGTYLITFKLFTLKKLVTIDSNDK